MKPSPRTLGFVSSLTLAGAIGALGCAAHPPPRELIAARAAYQSTASGPASTRAAADVVDAKKALDRAEASYADDPGGEGAAAWAYVATRKVASARAKANYLDAVEDGRRAQAELRDLRTQQEMAMRVELEKARGQLAKERVALSSEKQARAAAEEKTREALDKIAGMKSATTDRGLVLTLSGGLLFGSGKAVLLPAAQARLAEAAKALQGDSRSIIVVGHTDSVGSDEANQALSMKRAEAVRSYLVTHGVASEQVKAEGAGESMPISENSTPEGRATNRRVEIILENAKP